MKNTPFELTRSCSLSREERLGRLERILRHRLTEKQRRAITAVYFEGKSMTQVAREMGVGISAVSRLVARGKRRIGELMEI